MSNWWKTISDREGLKNKVINNILEMAMQPEQSFGKGDSGGGSLLSDMFNAVWDAPLPAIG